MKINKMKISKIKRVHYRLYIQCSIKLKNLKKIFMIFLVTLIENLKVYIFRAHIQVGLVYLN